MVPEAFPPKTRRALSFSVAGAVCCARARAREEEENIVFLFSKERKRAVAWLKKDPKSELRFRDGKKALPPDLSLSLTFSFFSSLLRKLSARRPPFRPEPCGAMRSLARCQPSLAGAGPSGRGQRAIPAQEHQGKERGESKSKEMQGKRGAHSTLQG